MSHGSTKSTTLGLLALPFSSGVSLTTSTRRAASWLSPFSTELVSRAASLIPRLFGSGSSTPVFKLRSFSSWEWSFHKRVLSRMARPTHSGLVVTSFTLSASLLSTSSCYETRIIGLVGVSSLSSYRSPPSSSSSTLTRFGLFMVRSLTSTKNSQAAGQPGLVSFLPAALLSLKKLCSMPGSCGKA